MEKKRKKCGGLERDGNMKKKRVVMGGRWGGVGVWVADEEKGLKTEKERDREERREREREQ